MLRARAADNEDFARSLIAWVNDEIALLPELTLHQLAVRDLRAAYSTLPGTVGEDSVAVPRVQGACEPCVSSANVNLVATRRNLQHPESAVSGIATLGCHTLAILAQLRRGSAPCRFTNQCRGQPGCPPYRWNRRRMTGLILGAAPCIFQTRIWSSSSAWRDSRKS